MILVDGKTRSSPLVQVVDRWLPPLLEKQLASLTNNGYAIAPRLFTDLDYVYGSAKSPTTLVLWRLRDRGAEGLPDDLKIIGLPLSESGENDVRSMLEEAIREGAWE
jgi:hypothetical protein